MPKKKKRTQKVTSSWRIPEPAKIEEKIDTVSDLEYNDHVVRLISDYCRKQIVTRQRQNVSVSYLASAAQEVMDTYIRLSTQYFTKLMSEGDYLNNDQIADCDTIDMSQVLHSDKVDEISFHADSFEQFDNIKKTLTIYLQSYIKFSDKSDMWVPECSGTVTMKAEIDDDAVRISSEIDDEGCECTVDLMTKISPKSLGWSYENVKFWEAVPIQNAVDQYYTYLNNEDHPLHALGRKFAHIIILSNYYLSSYRPTMEKESRSKRDTMPHPKKKITTRRVRTVGTVKFVSIKSPKKADSQTIRHWHVESWSTRGHVRTYKDGHQVYIRPTVHYRKALKKNGQEVVPRTIRIVDNEPREIEEDVG